MPNQTLTHEELFKQIKSARQIITYQPTLFGDQPRQSFPEYWRLVDIRTFIDLNKFPYNMTDKRETAPNWTNIGSILEKNTPQNVLDQVTNKYEWREDHIRKSADQGYEISRFLSWLVMKYSENYQNTSFQQAYFLSPGKELPEVEEVAAKLDRIQLRNRISQLQKKFNGIIYRIQGRYQNVFNDMYCALFQKSNPVSHLGDKPVAEYMNNPLLEIYGNTLSTIITRWSNYNVSYGKEQHFSAIVTQEMTNARKNIPGGKPEQYLIPTTATKVALEISNLEKEFIQKYAFAKQL